MLNRIYFILNWFFISVFVAFALGGSTPFPDVEINKLDDYTRDIEYNFFRWTLDATWIKLQQAAIGSPYYIKNAERPEIVTDYMQQMGEVLQTEWELEQIYTNPEILDPETESKELRDHLDALYIEQRQIAPFAESVLETQVSLILAEASLTTSGQPVPRPLYHISPLPTALVISPREIINQDEQVMLLADFPVDRQDALENELAADLNVSALIVPVGGIGIYPTMGMRSTNLSWTLSTIAHEWVHNYLTWHPLGLNYETSPALRTINETVASIVGDEIGEIALARFYPEQLTQERPPVNLLSLNGQGFNPDPPTFDFRAEMNETRIHTDELLAAGKISEAEFYMEMRRQYIWENGYAIRKLNQAYFAFYGAYADHPGGAAGSDPVGPAVRTLREQSDSLADFLHTVMVISSFEELQEMVE